MFRRILVPLDGSTFAEAAVPTAARLATLARAELELVLVHETVLSSMPAAEAFKAVEDETLGQEGETRYLRDVVGQLDAAATAPISTKRLDGFAGPALAGEIASWQPDLVVLSSHGRGPVGRVLFGGVTDYLIRHVSVPLLVMKPREDLAETAALRFESILVGWDLSRLGEAVLQPVGELARLTGARLELVHVVDTTLGVPLSAYPLGIDAGLLEQQRETAGRELARLAGLLRAQGLAVETRVAVGVGTAATLVELANENGHDLVALTTHGRGGVTRALVGSVADQVIRATEKPVLVLRPPADASRVPGRK